MRTDRATQPLAAVACYLPDMPSPLNTACMACAISAPRRVRALQDLSNTRLSSTVPDVWGAGMGSLVTLDIRGVSGICGAFPTGWDSKVSAAALRCAALAPLRPTVDLSGPLAGAVGWTAVGSVRESYVRHYGLASKTPCCSLCLCSGPA